MYLHKFKIFKQSRPPHFAPWHDRVIIPTPKYQGWMWFLFNYYQCAYASTEKDNLKQHIQAVQEPFKFIFNQCDYEPTHKTRLKLHMQSIHDHCEYASTMQINLVVINAIMNQHANLI